MKSAKIVFLSDRSRILQVGDNVRLTGHVRFINAYKHWCQIEDEENYFIIDLALCDTTEVMIGRLMQFAGEVATILDRDRERFEGCGQRMCLKATLARNVEGLDMSIYKQAVTARDKFLQDMM